MFKFIDDSITWIESLIVYDKGGQVKKNLKCFKGLKMVLKALRPITEEVCNEHGFKYMLTGRLNQDHLESTFSEVRRGCGRNDNPSPKRFFSSFREIGFH